MPDYRAMYLHLMRETEKAIRILEAAQKACEELYLQQEGELPLRIVELPTDIKNQNSGDDVIV